MTTSATTAALTKVAAWRPRAAINNFFKGHPWRTAGAAAVGATATGGAAAFGQHLAKPVAGHAGDPEILPTKDNPTGDNTPLPSPDGGSPWYTNPWTVGGIGLGATGLLAHFLTRDKRDDGEQL